MGPIPHGDLLAAYKSHILNGRPTAPEVNAFSTALGHPVSGLKPVLDDVLIVEALDLVRWALDNRPDRVSQAVNSARMILRA